MSTRCTDRSVRAALTATLLLALLSGCSLGLRNILPAREAPVEAEASIPADEADATLAVTEGSAETEGAGDEAPTPILPAPLTIEADPRAPGPAVRLFRESVAALEQGDFDRAEPLLLELTATYPRYASPHTNLGIVYAATGRDALALSAFDKAIELEPRDCAPRLGIGQLEKRRRDFSAAEQAYLDCIAKDPNSAGAHLNLGILYELHMGRLQSAVDAYHRFQALQPTADSRVAGWIVDLSRRIENANRVASGG